MNSYLLAAGVDLAQVANWQRQGKKGAKQPAPIPRPGAAAAKKRKRGPSLAERALQQGAAGNG